MAQVMLIEENVSLVPGVLALDDLANIDLLFQEIGQVLDEGPAASGPGRHT